jgi:sarcosine oxidase delta subunit
MLMPKRLALVVVATMVMVAPTAQAAPPEPTEAAAAAVAPLVKRTRTTQATYAVYYWNRISPRGAASEEWSAEFNQGKWHRVETPRDRMIADCRAMTGIDLNLETGEIVSGPAVARSACGINANRPLKKSEYLGRMDGRFGAYERVRLSDAGDVRTYDIDRDGVILNATYASVDKPDDLTLSMTTAGVERDLPEKDIFSPQSLTRSVVPDRFKQAPTRG